MAGSNVGDDADGKLTVGALKLARTEPAFEAREVVDADRSAVGRRHRDLTDCGDIAPLLLEHSNLYRVLFSSLPIRRDLVVTRDGQTEHAADGRHSDAEIGRSLTVDGNVNLRIRDAQRQLGIREAGQALRGGIRLQGIIGQAAKIWAEKLRVDRKSPAAFAATERVPDRKAGAVRRVRPQTTAHLRDHLLLRRRA